MQETRRNACGSFICSCIPAFLIDSWVAHNRRCAVEGIHNVPAGNLPVKEFKDG
jgi:hypothetical protein